MKPKLSMNDIDDLKEFYGLVKEPKLSANEEERIAADMLANIREHLRRCKNNSYLISLETS